MNFAYIQLIWIITVPRVNGEQNHTFLLVPKLARHILNIPISQMKIECFFAIDKIVTSFYKS
jgi:hypothetical protein